MLDLESLSLQEYPAKTTDRYCCPTKHHFQAGQHGRVYLRVSEREGKMGEWGWARNNMYDGWGT